MTHFPRSEALFERAKQHIPGGVNSPVRAFLSVGGTPPFIRSATGCTMTDADGNVYIDYIGSWGPMILGHNHPAIRQAVVAAAENGLSFGAATEAEVQMAETVCRMMPVLEMVRMVNSGTEAVMSALRAARGFTGRDKVMKFEGCYHGHADAMLVKAGSGVMTAGIPSSSGVPKGCAKDTLTATYNDLASVERLFAENKGEVACIIVEPVAANMGVVLPQKGFLQGLRALCDREGALLIFDEVITGFRLAPGGAAEKYQVRPDLMTFGKIIGAGMPVGAYGGRREVMEVIAPLGSVYQAGTLSGNPIAMAAGLCQLSMLENHPEVYEHIDRLGKMLGDGLRAIADRANIPVWVNQTGSLCSMFFTEQPVVDYESAKTADTARFAQFFHGMLARGIYLGPSQFEAAFVSAAHSESAIAQTLLAAEDVFAEL